MTAGYKALLDLGRYHASVSRVARVPLYCASPADDAGSCDMRSQVLVILSRQFKLLVPLDRLSPDPATQAFASEYSQSNK